MSNLYSVLMVDDEDEVIRIIRRKINWEELGFYVCGQAKNGIEALEMVEELQPDVVMTDIKMPYMDGLELSKQLKEKYSDIRIIIFSGFDEFDYVKQAIGLEVEEYLLKPIDAIEIQKVFEKTRNSLNEERNMRNNIAHLEKYYERSMPVLRENFFASLMEDDISENDLNEYLDEYKINLNSSYYAVTIIHTSERDISEELSKRLLKLSVRQYVEESFLNNEKNFIFIYRQDIVVLAQFDKIEDISRYTDMCDRFCKTIKKTCNAVVTIGIGKGVDNIYDISLSYKGAREALSYRTLYGSGNAINIIDIDPNNNYRLDIQEKYDLHDVFKMIKMGTEEDTKKEAEGYMDSLVKANLNLQEYNIVLMEMVTSFYRFVSNNEIDISVINDTNEDMYYKLLQMESLDQLRDWLVDVSLKIYSAINAQRLNKTVSFVKKAQDYVKENYSNPELGVDMICSELGVSSSYFSTVFKRETGKTFVNYLTECRMKEAERLLVEQNEKKYIIAEKVGYLDPGYFSYVFKKYYGVSPMKYKK